MAIGGTPASGSSLTTESSASTGSPPVSPPVGRAWATGLTSWSELGVGVRVGGSGVSSGVGGCAAEEEDGPDDVLSDLRAFGANLAFCKSASFCSLVAQAFLKASSFCLASESFLGVLVLP